MSRTTLKEIAKALDLSISTVSRALRDSYEIGSETKERVLEYAKSVHYRPNPIALSLKVNRSHSICVIVPEIANNFFSEVINGIDFTAHERGYNVYIFQTHESFDKEVASLEHGIDRRADGFIISLSGKTNDYSHLDMAKEEGLPTVFFDRVPPFENLQKVVVNNFEGAYNGTKYLISIGKKRIAHITSPLILSITKERLEGYKACLRDHNIAIDEDLIRFCSFDPQESFDTVKDVIMNKKVDALFLGSDRLSFNALNAIKILRPSLDNEIEMVAFSNMKYAHLLDPPMSTIVQPALEIGNTAAKLLIDIIEAKKNKKIVPQQIVLNTSLNLRNR